MKIALGTISEYKIRFLKKVCDDLDFQCEIIPLAAPSGVSDQPLSSAETKMGSINRATAALEHINGADGGLGIEVGYEKLNGNYHILCWAAFVSANKSICCCSESFPLPKFHRDIIDAGSNLGDHVRTFAALSDDADHQKIANDLIYREPYITDAVRQVVKRLSGSIIL